MTGKVIMHFTMSLDGFVAGPEHTMDFLERTTGTPGVVEEAMATTGAVLAGRDGFDSAIGDSRPYDEGWKGAIFVLTHHPEDARPVDDITILSCPVDEAVRIALEAADGKNVEILSPNIGKQLLELGLVDELIIHVAPVLLGDGIRLYDAPGGQIMHLDNVGGEPTLAADLHYRPRR